MVVRDLIDQNFDGTNTDYDGDIGVITGWYGENAIGPKVTVTNTDDFVVGGGDTEISAGGNNEKVQVRAGDILVNCWSGTREDLAGTTAQGNDINPKDMAWQMRREISQILIDSSPSEFNSLAPAAIRDIADPDHARGYLHRKEITVRYTYIS